jgi:hypothetical protein
MALAIGTTIEDGIQVVIFTYASSDPSDVGTSVKSYSARTVAEAQVEENTPRKTGTVIEVYEPDISALLAGMI